MDDHALDAGRAGRGAPDPSTYGESLADFYDELYRDYPGDTPQAAAFLADLAGTGRALELGIGTGRVALALSALGVAVEGIDASAAMLAKLAAKPDGAGIPVVLGDFADVGVEGRFGLVFVTFGTLFALLTQDDQLRCFANVAARLAPGGSFVVQAQAGGYTDQFASGQKADTGLVLPDKVILDLAQFDAATQRVSTRFVVLEEAGIRIYPMEIRFAPPAELDLMARLAGLRLRERWADWERRPFGGASPLHVSVYELSA